MERLHRIEMENKRHSEIIHQITAKKSFPSADILLESLEAMLSALKRLPAEERSAKIRRVTADLSEKEHEDLDEFIKLASVVQPEPFPATPTVTDIMTFLDLPADLEVGF
jgi:hypothetical protein